MLDQSQLLGQGLKLGSYDFDEETSGVVLVASSSGYTETIVVLADAVSFGEDLSNLDLVAPEISNVSALFYGGKMYVQATVTDNVAVSEVFVVINNQAYPLNANGDDIYSSIVDYNGPTDVTYYITAYDTSGNESIWDRYKGYVTRATFATALGIPPWGFYMGKNYFSNSPSKAQPGVSFCNQFCGDPINTQNGNLFEQVKLLALPGRPAIDFNISHNSQGSAVGIFGESWVHSYNYKLFEFDAPEINKVFVQYPGGRMVSFSGSNLEPDSGSFEKLIREGDTYKLINKDTSKVFFDEYGDVTRVEDANGNGIHFSYSEQSKFINLSKLIEIKADSGRTILLNYNSDNFVSKIIGPNNKVLELAYNSNADLIKLTDAKGLSTEFKYDNHALKKRITPEGYAIYTNTYDEKRRVTKQISGKDFLQNYKYIELENGSKTIVTDGNGKKGVYIYNKAGLMTSLIDETGAKMQYFYNSDKQETKLIDPKGNVTKYSYDDNGNRINETDALGKISKWEYNEPFNKVTKEVLKTNSFTTKNNYDNKGNLIKTINPLGDEISNKYNSFGQLIESKDFNGNATKYEYNNQGDLIKLTDALGNIDTFSYDALGRIKIYTNKRGFSYEYAYDKNDNILSISGPNGYSLGFVYDKNNRLIRELDTNGGVTKYNYDNSENIIKVTDALGNVTKINWGIMNEKLEEIDPLGRITKHEYTNNYLPKKTSKATGTSDAATTSTTYNKLKLPTKIVNARGVATKFVYDALNRVTKKIDDANNLAATSVTTYNPRGKITKVTDANGNITKYKLDKLDRIIEITDALGAVTSFAYDSNSNIISTTNPNGNKTQFEYDQLNRLVKKIDPKGFEYTYEYDANDNLTRTTDPNKIYSVNEYDAFDRLSLQKQGCKDGVCLKTTAYEYDLIGNITAVTDALGNTTSFEYDLNNRNTKITDALGNSTLITYDKVGNILKITDRNGNITSNEYDNLNRLIKQINAAGNTTKFAYDKIGNVLTEINPRGAVTSYNYDGLNRVTSSLDALGNNTSYAYDLVGNLLKLTNAKGYTQTFSYDNLNRLLSKTNEEGHTEKFSYDAVGNVLSKTDANNNATQFKYDAHNRVTELVDALNSIETYNYDPVGNILELTDKNGHPTEYSYDNLYRQTQIKDAEGYTTQISYDANSNVTKITDGNGHSDKYSYDELNRLVTTINSENEETVYNYDNEGNQTTITAADGIVKKYIYDKIYRLAGVIENFQEGENSDHEVNVATTYKYDAANNLVEIIDPNSNSTKFSYDLLNRQIQETNALGNSWKFGYDSLGNQTLRVDPSTSSGQAQIIRYEYYPDNQLKNKLYPDGSAIDFTYDRNNNRSSMRDLIGTSTWNYDKLNRPTVVIDSLGKKLELSYDKVGNRTQLIYPDGIMQTFGYFDNNWLKETTTGDLGTTTYKRDGVGNTLEQLNPNNTSSKYSYDKENRILDIINNSEDRTKINSSFKYTYNNVGQRTKIEADYGWMKPAQGSGGSAKVVTNYSFDSLRRLTESTNTLGETNTYSYDPAGNRLTHEVTLDKKSPGFLKEETSVYTYNSVNQLLNVLTESGSTPQKYSKYNVLNPLYALQNELVAQNGKGLTSEQFNQVSAKLNQIIADLEANTLQYKDVPQELESLKLIILDLGLSKGTQQSMLVKVNLASTQANTKGNKLSSATYGYDSNGNRILEELSSDKGPKQLVKNYAYDYENRLTNVAENKGGSSKNLYGAQYDGLGRRLVKFNPNKTLYYTYDNLDPVVIRNIQNNQYENFYRDNTTRILSSTRRSLGEGGSQTFPSGSEGQSYWYHHDAINSIVGITKHDGQSNHNYRYSDFGELQPNLNGSFTAPHNSFTYTGVEIDEHTGLYEFYSRAYDPSVGVWTRQDDYRGELTDPMSLHRYAYVNQRPVDFWDMYGYYSATETFNNSMEAWVGGGIGIVDYGLDMGLGLASAGALVYDTQHGGTMIRDGVNYASNLKDHYRNQWFGVGDESYYYDSKNAVEGFYDGWSNCGYLFDDNYSYREHGYLVARMFGDTVDSYYIAKGLIGAGRGIINWGRGTIQGLIGSSDEAANVITKADYTLNPQWKNWESYMSKRGWTTTQIDEALSSGSRIAHNGSNYLNPGNPMSLVTHTESGKSLVIDDITGDIIQLGGEGFKF